jgi:hypothetical protein
MDLIIERMRGMNVLEKEFGGYGYRTLYEVVTMGLKNKLMEIQGRIKRNRSNMREYLLGRIQYMIHTFGDNTVQAEDARGELLYYGMMTGNLRRGRGNLEIFWMKIMKKRLELSVDCQKRGGQMMTLPR